MFLISFFQYSVRMGSVLVVMAANSAWEKQQMQESGGSESF